ncbi:MAG: TRAP transporter fused permease subunit [bacterium]|nr:TRAP transporter fused permease subunit [bacterium]
MSTIEKPQSHSTAPDTNSFWRWVIGLVCVAFTLFQIYTAGFGQYPNMIQRSIHAAFSLVLCFLIIPTVKGKPAKGRPSVLNIGLASISAGLCIYIVFSYDRLMESIGLEALPYEVVMGWVLILLVIEAARRATGVMLPLLATATMGYALLGKYIPGYWGHAGFSFQYVIEYLYLGPEGVWGVLTGISATLVAVFIIFGAILMTTGGADSFMKIALLLGGRSYGGAAKVATVASGLFGMLSGAAIANVATTGNFTIPMMKRLGYRDEFAAGVEATASSGGQITPPIMGAGAFIMSELIGQPYLKIALAATLPAFLFYVCVWISIDLEARKTRLKRVPPEDIPEVRSVINLRSSGPLVLTIGVLLTSMLMGHTPTKAAFFAIITNLGLFMLTRSIQKKSFSERCRVLLSGVEKAGRGMITVVTLLVCAQIVISMISLTGLGIKMSELIIGASSGSVFLALVLAAVVSLIMGMGIPTTAAYVLAASVVGPALKMMGVNLLSAHMFIFYCAILSGLTPPVCTAVFAASTIAQAGWLKVAGVSIRLAIMKYIIPFFFIYRPSILFLGHWYQIVETIIVTWMSATLFAIGTVGYYRLPINIFLRGVILVVALVLIIPGIASDAIGIFFMGGLIVWQRIQSNRLGASANEPGSGGP